jgi:putative CocE/NonD family hydrolase
MSSTSKDHRGGRHIDRRHFLSTLGLGAASLAAFAGPSLGQERAQPEPESEPVREGNGAPAAIKVMRNVYIPMRDGVRLASDILIPPGAGPFPTVLTRTPYGKNRWLLPDPEAYPRHGYVLVGQDCRGRYGSQGDWFPFVNEAQDGYDTIEWIAQQPWSNGRVGMVGGSYQGLTQWAAASTCPPHLTCIVPQETPVNHYENAVYRGGAMQLGVYYPWALYCDDRGECQHIPRQQLPELFRTLPLAEADRAAVREIPHWRTWVAHPRYDAFWEPQNFEAALERISVPALNIGGWYDMYPHDALHCFAKAQAHGGSMQARQGARAIIGPWTHGTWCRGKGGRKYGELDFGPESELEVDAQVLRFLNRWLKNEDDGLDREPPLWLFVMGRNQWRRAWQWPLEGTREQRLYLHSRGKANSAGGDGILSAEPPADEPPDRFRYDPLDPAPTVGGGHSGNFAGIPAGPLDQRSVEQRRDVLVYTTQPLPEDLAVIGPVCLHLVVASSATDTDFTGKLVDVYPDGRAIIIGDSIRRASCRESTREPSPIVPAQTYELTIDLGATANCFLRGHRIRVEVSSSSFPRYARNLNTGLDSGQTTQVVVADQTVYHQRGLESWLELPVAEVPMG